MAEKQLPDKVAKELRQLVSGMTIDQLRILNLFIAEEIIKKDIYEN